MKKIFTLGVALSLSGLITYGVALELKGLHNVLPAAVKLDRTVKVDPRIEVVGRVLARLKCPDRERSKLAKAIIEASDKIAIDPTLIAVLMKTESGFNMKAESEKGYKGLMQTPYASKQWADVDVLIGIRILEEKLKLTSGDIELALALYKGGNNPMAKRQAAQVLALYKEVKNELRSTGRG